MTESIKTSTRAAQYDAATDPAVAEASIALYDALDALTPEQRSLFIGQSLQIASMAMKELVKAALTGQPAHEIQSYAMLLNGYIAMPGYLNAVTREEAGYTTTGDSKVTEVLTQFKDALQNSVLHDVDPEQREQVKAVGQRVKARLEADPSLDFETVVEEEMDAEGLDFASVEAALTGKHPAPAKTSGDEGKSYGMYL